MLMGPQVMPVTFSKCSAPGGSFRFQGWEVCGQVTEREPGWSGTEGGGQSEERQSIDARPVI